MTYQEYIASPAWHRLRDMTLIRDKHTCRACRKGWPLHVHHLEYPDKWEDDSMSNLVTLCAKHHMNRHGLTIGATHISEVIPKVLRALNIRKEVCHE